MEPSGQLRKVAATIFHPKQPAGGTLDSPAYAPAMNASRHPKNIMEGDHVFRKKPAFARPHKGTFPEKSCGPYVVTRKLGEAHVILQDPETGLMVDKGVPVPMDQIIIFPYRKPCTFFEGGEEAEREMRPDKGTEPDLIPQTWSQTLSGVGAPTRDDDAGIPLRAKWTKLVPGAHVIF